MNAINEPLNLGDLLKYEEGRLNYSREQVTEIAWSSPTRFVLKERRVFMTRSLNLARGLGQYGKQVDKYKTDDKYYVEPFKVYMSLIWLNGTLGTGAGDLAQ